MKLQRHTAHALWDQNGDPVNGEQARAVYRAADVDALLARIRKAVEVERDATLRHLLSRAKERDTALLAAERACAALDALLSGEG